MTLLMLHVAIPAVAVMAYLWWPWGTAWAAAHLANCVNRVAIRAVYRAKRLDAARKPEPGYLLGATDDPTIARGASRENHLTLIVPFRPGPSRRRRAAFPVRGGEPPEAA
jgi:hypothetical protein